ncbi:Retrovirus-related Pol polyprotein from transposon opus, partial [Stegodyphus mimosarum]
MPKMKTHLKRLLGLCNYYHNYIPRYAEIAYSLMELAKNKELEIFQWKEIHKSAFQQLKEQLVKATQLINPIPQVLFVIHSDASEIRIGACLSQQKGAKQFSMCYAINKLSKPQQSWPTIEREAYAIVWALKEFVPYIFGSSKKTVTDHNPLAFIVRNTPQSSKLQRWAIVLQKYNLEIEHHPGRNLVNADALSRLPTP